MLDAGSVAILASISFLLVVTLTGSLEVGWIFGMTYSTWLCIGAMTLEGHGWRRSVQGSQDAQIWAHWGKDTLAIALWPMVKRHILARVSAQKGVGSE